MDAWNAGIASLVLILPTVAIRLVSFLASFPSSAFSDLSSLDRIRVTFSFNAAVLSFEWEVLFSDAFYNSLNACAFIVALVCLEAELARRNFFHDLLPKIFQIFT